MRFIICTICKIFLSLNINMSNKPVVFISSTIHDFRDLRSSLKYWIEELGYDVRLSEYNDFPVSSDANSYDNCFRAIDQCDYFILLIGNRIGGWYDPNQRISITQEEYRRAYQRMREGGTIKIISFVRKELLDVRQDRKELAKYLKTECEFLSTDQKNKITYHPCKFLDDAAFILSFIEEVGRYDEMQESLGSNSPRPEGNWIYSFVGFENIIASLEMMFEVDDNLREKSMRYNLKMEISRNLSRLLDDFGNKLIAPLYNSVECAYNTRLKSADKKRFRIQCRDLVTIMLFYMSSRGLMFSNLFLEKALQEGTFLSYDNMSNSFGETPLHRALLLLNKYLFYLMAPKSESDNKQFAAFMMQVKNAGIENLKDSDEIEIPDYIVLVPALGVYLQQKNVVIIMAAILKYLNGNNAALDNLEERLVSTYVLSDENSLEDEKKAHPSIEDAERWALEC